MHSNISFDYPRPKVISLCCRVLVSYDIHYILPAQFSITAQKLTTALAQLKTTPTYMLELYRVRSLAQCGCVLCSGCNQDVIWISRSTFKCIHVIGRIQFLAFLVLKSPLSCWLLARNTLRS